MAVDAHVVAAPHHAAGGLAQTWHNLPTAGKVAVVGGLALVLFMVYRAVHGGGAASSALGQAYPTAGVPQDTGGLPGGGALGAGGGQGQDTSGAPQSANPPQPSVIVLAAPDTGQQPTTSNAYTDNSVNIGTQNNTQNTTTTTQSTLTNNTTINNQPGKAPATPASHPVPVAPAKVPAPATPTPLNKVSGVSPQAINIAKAGLTTSSLQSIVNTAWTNTTTTSTHPAAPAKPAAKPVHKTPAPTKKTSSTNVITKTHPQGTSHAK